MPKPVEKINFGGISVVACDFDGTYLAPGHKLDPACDQARRRFEATGGVFIPATGRNLSSAQLAVGSSMNLRKGPGVYVNGAVAFGPKHEVVYAESIDLMLVNKLACWWQKQRHDSIMYFITPEECNVLDVTHPLAPFAHEKFGEPKPVLISLETLLETPVLAVVVASESEEWAEEATKKVQEFCGRDVVMTRNTATVFSLTCRDICKMRALRKVLGAMNVVAEQSAVAIGDDWNDASILAGCKYGVAMGNAPERLQATAKAVTAPNTASGAAKVLDRIADKREGKGSGQCCAVM